MKPRDGHASAEPVGGRARSRARALVRGRRGGSDGRDVARRTSGWVALAGLLGAAGGALLIAAGVQAGVPQAAPLPAQTFTAAPAPTASERAPAPVSLEPRRVAIPSLDVTAPIEDRPVRGGELVIPGDPRTVARWDGGAGLDAPEGTLLLAGHVDVNGSLGALNKLASLAPGALIHTSDDDGTVSAWRVTALEVHRKDRLPEFAAEGERRLVLVTCGGPVERTNGYWSYRDNVVVTATPAEDH